MQNSRANIGLLFLVATILLSSAGAARAQQPEASSKPKAEEAEKQPGAYRMDFSINELEDGKILNSRQYSLNGNGGDWNTLKIGTRVPMEAKQGEFQYLDVGTNIQARLREKASDLALEVRADITNFATPDRQSSTNMPPFLRQMQINGSTVIQLAKPLVVGVVDDPNSKRQFQLSVTVSKIR
jgi:hypothetical protein